MLEPKGRMSARYIGKEVGKSAKWVYEMWKDMGIVIKDKYGDWILTDAGRALNGKMSKFSNFSVPTFKAEEIIPKMEEFFIKHKMK